MLLNAVAIGGYAFLGTASPIWILAVLFFIQGAGLGLAVPAATSTVMDVLPRERAGAGSALTNTARQVAVALGVAVLGSILAQSYRDTLVPDPGGAARGGTGRGGPSITATQAVAAHLGHAGQFLLDPANVAFVDAMRITTLVAAGIAVLGGVVVMRWMPGRQRPNIEELVAAEVAAAERELEAGNLPESPSCRNGKSRPVKVKNKIYPNGGGFHIMRTHDSHVDEDADRAAITGNPATITARPRRRRTFASRRPPAMARKRHQARAAPGAPTTSRARTAPRTRALQTRAPPDAGPTPRTPPGALGGRAASGPSRRSSRRRSRRSPSAA